MKSFSSLRSISVGVPRLEPARYSPPAKNLARPTPVFPSSRDPDQWLPQPVAAACHLATGEPAGDATGERPGFPAVQSLHLSHRRLRQHLGPQLAGQQADRARKERRHVQQRSDGGREVRRGESGLHAGESGVVRWERL